MAVIEYTCKQTIPQSIQGIQASNHTANNYERYYWTWEVLEKWDSKGGIYKIATRVFSLGRYKDLGLGICGQ